MQEAVDAKRAQYQKNGKYISDSEATGEIVAEREAAKYVAEFVNNKKGASQSLNMQSPQFTPKTPLATAPNDVNVQQKDNDVKRSTKDETAAEQSGVERAKNIYGNHIMLFAHVVDIIPLVAYS